MRFIIWERSVQKKTDFWIVLCCILKEPKINMLEFSCWCKKNSQSIHEELHSIPLIFLNKKSEIWNDFTIFEKWKVKNFLPSLFSRSESENQMTQNRDREVKVKIKWLKIEIEKWIFKKNLENSRESRLSLVTAPDPTYHILLGSGWCQLSSGDVNDTHKDKYKDKDKYADKDKYKVFQIPNVCYIF